MNNPYQSPAADIDSAALDKQSTVGTVQLWRATFWLYPVTLVSTFYATWLVAWLLLGHMPRPSLDDPKSISIFVDVFSVFAGLLLVGFPAAAIVGTVAVLSIPQHSWLRRGVRFSLYSTLWISAISFLVWDPLQVGQWFMD